MLVLQFGQFEHLGESGLKELIMQSGRFGFKTLKWGELTEVTNFVVISFRLENMNL